jgi:hypothetical protein
MRLAVASLLSLIACSRTQVAAPDASADASFPSTLADAAGDAGTTDGGAEARAPTACLGHRLEWRRVGGLMGDHDEHSISGCRTYRVTLAPDDDGPRRPRKSCTHDLPVGGPAATLEDLALAISDPAVTEAFVRGGMVGASRTPYDGTDLVVTLDGKGLAFGRGVPVALEKLPRVLADIGSREVMRCREGDGGVMQGDASAPRRRGREAL